MNRVSDKGSASFGRGSLFPLSILPAEPMPRGMARGCRQRVLRRARRREELNEGLQALNWLAGLGKDAGTVSQLTGPVHDRLASLIAERGPPVPEHCTNEAVSALLGAEVGYDHGDATLATYLKGHVSLPDSVDGAPFAHEVGPQQCRDLLVGFEEQMLLSDDDFLVATDHEPAPKLHMDPVLDKNATEYREFVMDLYSRGLVHFTQDPKEFCTVFFVRKKNGSLRLVVDARRSNRRFRKPPGVAMATPESFARMETTGRDDVFVATTDVKDCFHRLRITSEFGKYFCLPPLTLDKEMTATLDGDIDYTAPVWPCLAVLPMGFTWSLYFAQQINKDIVSKTQALRQATVLED